MEAAPGCHAGRVRRRPVEGAVARLRSGRPLLHLERRLAGGTEGLAAAKQQADDRGSEGAGQASARGHRRTSCLLGTSQTRPVVTRVRSEEQTSELQSLMRTSYAVFCMKTKQQRPTSRSISHTIHPTTPHTQSSTSYTQ